MQFTSILTVGLVAILKIAPFFFENFSFTECIWANIDLYSHNDTSPECRWHTICGVFFFVVKQIWIHQTETHAKRWIDDKNKTDTQIRYWECLKRSPLNIGISWGNFVWLFNVCLIKFPILCECDDAMRVHGNCFERMHSCTTHFSSWTSSQIV